MRSIDAKDATPSPTPPLTSAVIPEPIAPSHQKSVGPPSAPIPPSNSHVRGGPRHWDGDNHNNNNSNNARRSDIHRGPSSSPSRARGNNNGRRSPRRQWLDPFPPDGRIPISQWSTAPVDPNYYHLMHTRGLPQRHPLHPHSDGPVQYETFVATSTPTTTTTTDYPNSNLSSSIPMRPLPHIPQSVGYVSAFPIVPHQPDKSPVAPLQHSPRPTSPKLNRGSYMDAHLHAAKGSAFPDQSMSTLGPSSSDAYHGATYPGQFADINRETPMQTERSTQSFAAFSPPSSVFNPLALEGIRPSDLNVALLDVESLNPGSGPLRAIGIVLASYQTNRTATDSKSSQTDDRSKHRPLFEVRHRAQWVVRRTADEFEPDGLRFWKGKAASADRFFDSSPAAMDSATAARLFRQYIDALWAGVPGLCLLIDDRHTDGVLLNQFLAQHGFWPIQYDSCGTYQPYVYVSRDLMRGAFGALCPAFTDLRKPDLYRAIHAYWARLRRTLEPGIEPPQVPQTDSATTASSPGPASPTYTEFARAGGIHFGPAANEHDFSLGPETKHVPCWDALQALSVFFLLEDAKRLFHAQLARLPSGSLCLPQ